MPSSVSRKSTQTNTSATAAATSSGTSLSPETNAPVHDQIARRAHELWRQEGCPDGRHEAHWREAEHQINGTGPEEQFAPARPRRAG